MILVWLSLKLLGRFYLTCAKKKINFNIVTIELGLDIIKSIESHRGYLVSSGFGNCFRKCRYYSSCYPCLQNSKVTFLIILKIYKSLVPQTFLKPKCLRTLILLVFFPEKYWKIEISLAVFFLVIWNGNMTLRLEKSTFIVGFYEETNYLIKVQILGSFILLLFYVPFGNWVLYLLTNYYSFIR